MSVDRPARTTVSEMKKPEDAARDVKVDVDVLHVCPSQTAPDFLRAAPLADTGEWVDIDRAKLRQKTDYNIWSADDVTSASNAKTAAPPAQTGSGRGRERDGRHRGPRAGGATRRLWVLFLDGEARQDRAGRIRIWRRSAALGPNGCHRRDETDPGGSIPEGVDTAPDILEGDVAREGMDGMAQASRPRRRADWITPSGPPYHPSGSGSAPGPARRFSIGPAP